MEYALKSAGASYDKSLTPSGNSGRAIDELADKGTPPVILIDEYDDPVACALKNPDVAEKIRDALAPVYKQMKDRSGKMAAPHAAASRPNASGVPFATKCRALREI